VDIVKDWTDLPPAVAILVSPTRLRLLIGAKICRIITVGDSIHGGVELYRQLQPLMSRTEGCRELCCISVIKVVG
jgi:hypothetical protein